MGDFLKENFQVVCLLVGIAGVLVSVISLVINSRKKKRDR